ncbi:AAA family ATPase [Salirhabdus sp. Marseille-P4669]|uniref:AAA family ATPase n=1 Tax=Salirhabdus sp. Marseille-P4669 TaxID=2042310 RepID=UPI000C7C1B13|nr:AAA family ATPase [Salirhabdus sp. Marseille-P4669]
MRALQLTMCAFGPYKEKQTINFTQLGEETLFLITGPTGAGKTTIFDAMCFALYGKASGDDREHDTLRSHFADIEVPTEVEFRFRLHQKEFEIIRSPKQNKKKARGDGFTEQPPQAELYEIIDGEKHLLYGKVKEVNEAIEDMLQLDYEQFRKMVMIPQGEFRRLISENSKEREEILQKIFHTYFYDQITKKLTEESKVLQNDIDQLSIQEKNEIRYVNWSEDYDVEQVDSGQAKEDLHQLIVRDQEVLVERQKQLEEGRMKLNELQNNFYAAKELLNQFTEMNELAIKLKALHEQQSTIEKEKQLLHKANAASALKGYETQVKQRNKEVKEITASLETRNNILQEVLLKFKQDETQYEALKKEEPLREQVKEEIRVLKDEFTKHQKIEQLAEQEKTQRKTYDEKVKIANNNEESVKRTEEEIEKIDSETEKTQHITEQYFEWNNRMQLFEQLVEKGSNVELELRKLFQYRNQYVQIKKKKDEAVQLENDLKETLKKLEQEQRTEYAALLASSLETGEACPVCGSTHHPTKAEFHNRSISNEQIDLQRKKLEEQQQIVTNLVDQFADIRSKGESQRQLIDNTIAELKKLSGIEITTENIGDRISEWKQELSTIRTKRKDTEEQLQKIKEKVDKQKKLKKELTKLREDTQKKLEDIQQLKEELVRMKTQKDQFIEELIYKNEDIHSLKKQLRNKEKWYEEKIVAWETIQKQYEQVKEQKNRLKVEVDGLKTQLVKAEKTLVNVTDEFKRELEHKQFSSHEEYKESLMEESEIKRLEQNIKRFEEELYATKNRYEILKKDLHDKEKPEIETLEEAVQNLSKQLEADAEVLQKHQVELERHKEILGRLQALMSKKKELEEQFFDIGELAKLSKGDNPLRLSFERYVLSAFLDEILFQANIRLEKMTDHRYQLRRSDQIAKRGAQSGLDLEVIDYYTGQNRSVKTLSGGEGFKAALSLALGMADVVQAHSGGVELDTLFIDEGFGTLDEISLEQALNCLSDLQKGNRMLGIISHVPKLKDEIRAQLTIQTSHSGSKISLSIS